MTIERLLIEVARAHKILNDVTPPVDVGDSRARMQEVRRLYGWALAGFRQINPSNEERVTFLVETEMLRRRLDALSPSGESSAAT